MKIFFILLLFLTTTTFAQDRLKIGFKNGLAFSSLEWTNPYGVNYKNRIGYSSQLFGEFFDHKYWALNCGLGYTQKGGRDSMYWDDGMGNVSFLDYYDVNFDYINIDFLFKAKYQFWKLQPYILIGPKAELLVNHYAVVVGMGDEVTHYVIGINYLFGLSLNLKSVQLLIDWRKDFIFNSLYKQSDGELKEKTAIISIGVLIPIRK